MMLFDYTDILPFQADNDHIISKIDSFKSYTIGWNFGAGKPALSTTIIEAIRVYRVGKRLGFSADAFLSKQGDITVSFSHEDNFIDVKIYEDLSYSVRYEKGIGVEYNVLRETEKISFVGLNLFLTNVAQQWNLLEQFTSKTTTQKNRGLTATSLITWEAAFQSLNETAQYNPAEGYANTYHGFIQPLSEPQYSIAV